MTIKKNHSQLGGLYRHQLLQLEHCDAFPQISEMLIPVKFTPNTSWKHVVQEEVQVHLFLISALVRGGCREECQILDALNPHSQHSLCSIATDVMLVGEAPNVTAFQPKDHRIFRRNVRPSRAGNTYARFDMCYWCSKVVAQGCTMPES
jgi:hypothetical protein